MTCAGDHPWLKRYAWFTAAATLVLICFGGLVTSKGAGMAVPDWPNSYGYNMFFFPVSRWVGNIFYEHTHRLVASGVGLLTTVLAVWLWRREPRSILRWLGLIAWVGVVAQGILGGLRVTLLKDQLGIVHAVVAQLFFVLLCAIALLLTPGWQRGAVSEAKVGRLSRFFLCGAGLIGIQLALGATMRHQHAGLAIPDFPLAYGRLWPRLDAASVAFHNQHRLEVEAVRELTATQIVLQMVHRLLAVGILTAVALTAAQARRRLGPRDPLTKTAWAWLALIGGQILLGAATIWTGKSADVATAHVAVGALSLATGFLAFLVASRRGARRAALGALPAASAPATV